MEYWGRPQATQETFTEINRQKWFKTGDVAVFERNRYWIKGRQSADIIKSSGYKISALDIEQVLTQHPLVQECTVFGIADPVYGERITAMIVPKLQTTSTTNSSNNADEIHSNLHVKKLREWGEKWLAKYKLPTVVKLVDELPRNAMGKINKKMLAKEFRDPTSVY